MFVELNLGESLEGYYSGNMIFISPILGYSEYTTDEYLSKALVLDPNVFNIDIEPIYLVTKAYLTRQNNNLWLGLEIIELPTNQKFLPSIGLTDEENQVNYLANFPSYAVPI